MAMAAYFTKLKTRGLIFLLLSSAWLQGQGFEVETVSELPAGLEECSGMTVIGPNALVMINDSGNDAELFICDTLGQLISRVALIGLPNHDWESITFGNGRLYIGDFGNNANQRQNLEILVLDVSRLLDRQEWSLLGRIPFHYPEQTAFPPNSKSDYYYDLEAMIFERDSLFLFTKNRTKPFDGLVKVYGLGTQLEAQKARLIKTFKTDIGLKHFNWVAGASLGPKGDDLFLLGYSRVWYCSAWRSQQRQKLYSIDLDNFSQKEALSLHGKYLYYAEERTPGNSPKLKKMRTTLFEVPRSENNGDTAEISLNRTQFKQTDSLKLRFRSPFLHLGCKYSVFNTQGELLFEGKLQEAELRSGLLPIPWPNYYPGRYILSIDGPFKRAFVLELQ